MIFEVIYHKLILDRNRWFDVLEYKFQLTL